MGKTPRRGRAVASSTSLTVRLSGTDQAAVEVLKQALRTESTTQTVKEAMKLALTTVVKVMQERGMTTFTELHTFLDQGAGHDSQANSPGPEVPSNP